MSLEQVAQLEDFTLFLFQRQLIILDFQLILITVKIVSRAHREGGYSPKGHNSTKGQQ